MYFIIPSTDNSVLFYIRQVNEKLSEAYKTLDKCKDELVQLKAEYNKLEMKKRKASAEPEPTGTPILATQTSLFNLFNDDELPFN